MKISWRILPMLILLPNLATAGTLVLKRAWVQKYKNRATISASFVPDKTHPTPNTPAKDGDLHVAGRAQQDVGLPMVAEIVNARTFGKPAADFVHTIVGKNQAVTVVGAWRLWFEHPATKQTQGTTIPVPTNPNPDHSFEIHPIVQMGTADVPNSFVAITGFKPYDTATAFGDYEKNSISVSANASTIVLASSRAVRNYAEFTFQAIGKPAKLDDNGYAVLANVESDTDTPAAQNVRMIFVPDTPPWQAANSLSTGDTLHVIGIPRVNLAAVSDFVDQSGGKLVTRKMPYEMIIVAVLK